MAKYHFTLRVRVKRVLDPLAPSSSCSQSTVRLNDVVLARSSRCGVSCWPPWTVQRSVQVSRISVTAAIKRVPLTPLRLRTSAVSGIPKDLRAGYLGVFRLSLPEGWALIFFRDPLTREVTLLFCRLYHTNSQGRVRIWNVLREPKHQKHRTPRKPVAGFAPLLTLYH